MILFATELALFDFLGAWLRQSARGKKQVTS